MIITATNGLVRIDTSTQAGLDAVAGVVPSYGYGDFTDGTATSIAFDGTPSSRSMPRWPSCSTSAPAAPMAR